MTSPFSLAEHSRPSTELQLRRNHLSALAASVKRAGLAETAIGSMAFPARVCPADFGSLVWQLVHDGVSGLPPLWVAALKDFPSLAEKPVKPGSAALA